MVVVKQNKISEEETESTSRQFLKKGGGRLGMFAGRGVAPVPTATSAVPTANTGAAASSHNGSSKGAGYSGLHARTLHFKPSPTSSPRESPMRSSSPSHQHHDRGGNDSLNTSGDEGDFRDFERHIKQVHSMFLHSGGSGLAASSSAAAAASSRNIAASPLETAKVTTRLHHSAAAVSNAAPRSPHVDFSPVMQALEVKLAKMTQENIALKAERETLKQSFEEELGRMREMRERDIIEAKKGQEEEIKRLKDQVRLMDRRQKAVSKHTEIRKERLEIEQLQRELQKLRTESAARDSTWRITFDKLKASNAELVQRNADLEEQIISLSETLRKHAEADWASERDELHEQIDALIQRSKELEMQLADEREVNSALARLRREASPKKIDGAPRRSTSPSQSSSPISSRSAPSLRSPTTVRPSSADIPRSSLSGEDLRSGSATHQSPMTASSTWHDNHSRPQQAWTDPRPASTTIDQSRLPGVVSERRLDNGGMEQIRTDGSRVIIFRNGTTKEQTSEGRQIVRFGNGDVKEVAADGTITYFYKEARTTHITYPGGLQLMHFPNNQMEKHYPDGTKEIVFANKVRKKIYADGQEEFFPS